MTTLPQVTVICLCYNQSQWVEESILSVINQTYANIQLIVVDDASTDESVSIIKKLAQQYPRIELLLLDQNVGNCKAVNKALTLATGEFIIDLAADDVLTTNRIERQVHSFLQQSAHVGVVFTDATYIDARGNHLYHHYEDLHARNLVKNIPTGDVYKDVIGTYFIAAPTMMIRKSVLDELGGYDEVLAYEDFDFWIRSARKFNYVFLNERLTLIRKSERSMSASLYKKGDQQLRSTYLICLKIKALNQNPEEDRALIKRLRYEFRHAVLTDNFQEAKLFFELLKEMNGVRVWDRLGYVLGLLPFSKYGILRRLKR